MLGSVHETGHSSGTASKDYVQGLCARVRACANELRVRRPRRGMECKDGKCKDGNAKRRESTQTDAVNYTRFTRSRANSSINECYCCPSHPDGLCICPVSIALLSLPIAVSLL